MNHLKILKSPVEMGLNDFSLKGVPVINQQRVLKDIEIIKLYSMNSNLQV
ncbi:MAG: hypothetical protein WC865_15160 [Bacteroidales bacterium]